MEPCDRESRLQRACGLCFAMTINGLYVVTDIRLRPERSHVQIAQAAIAGGAKLIQLRDKDASDRQYYETALEIRAITSQAQAAFFVNDRVHIAAAVGADGINIGQSDIPISAARAVLGRKTLIGVSAENLEQALRAADEGADYVGFGPVFATATKDDAGAVSGLEILSRVCAECSVPVVAIGGVSAANIRKVAETGAASAAVVSAVVCAEDMVAATADLIRRFQTGAKTSDTA